MELNRGGADINDCRYCKTRRRTGKMKALPGVRFDYYVIALTYIM